MNLFNGDCSISGFITFITVSYSTQIYINMQTDVKTINILASENILINYISNITRFL